MLEEAVTEIKADLTTKVDDYLNYVVEQWLADNEIAIESGLRAELTEDFIAGLRNLFAEHYIDVPTEKVDLVDELAGKVEELEGKLNEEIERGVGFAKALVESRKNDITREVCDGLTTTQIEKIKSLAESVEFSTEDEYKNKQLLKIQRRSLHEVARLSLSPPCTRTSYPSCSLSSLPSTMTDNNLHTHNRHGTRWSGMNDSVFSKLSSTFPYVHRHATLSSGEPAGEIPFDQGTYPMLPSTDVE